MYWIEWLKELYKNEPTLSIALIVLAGLLPICAFIAYMVRSESIFTSCFSALGGGLGIMVICLNVDKKAAWISICLLMLLGGILYLMLFSALTFRKTALERKRRRAEISRRLQYTLPDRHNGYIRERLNTTLHVEEREGEEKRVALRLGYACALLCKVQAAPLTVAERLQTEEIGKMFALYKGKECFKIEELRILNDVCATLLKLSAKYAV